MIIVGLDLSLTSTGIALIMTGDGREYREVRRIESTGRTGASLYQRHARLDLIAADVVASCNIADLVVIEGPSYGSQTGSQHDRSGLWWLVVDRLRNDSLRVVEVPPSCRMKYATGKGNARKDVVLAAVVRRYPRIDVTGNDEADALVLAAMGARWLGHPIDDLPQTHLAAMAKVHWPEVQPT